MIKKFLDLGMQPLANNYLRKKDLTKKKGGIVLSFGNWVQFKNKTSINFKHCAIKKNV
tara:strand:- start:213 stop:386 length:174 start_codon:yes stop_codon:yes gene_type:complete